MENAVFLSASVPDPRRAAHYASSADPIAIAAAVSALVFVTLGRRRLVWGGQPAITQIVLAAAENMGVDFGGWVRLYQSDFFADDFPDENKRFRNVVYTPKTPDDREASLLTMRTCMFEQTNFHAAVFIGGMKGIVDEYDLFRKLRPNAEVVPMVSTGGATKDVAAKMGTVDPILSNDLDYVSVFHRKLDIAVLERRYPNPADQPPDPHDRLWPDPSPPFSLTP